MGLHVLVGEFFEHVIKIFGRGSFGFPLGGIVVDVVLV